MPVVPVAAVELMAVPDVSDAVVPVVEVMLVPVVSVLIVPVVEVMLVSVVDIVELVDDIAPVSVAVVPVVSVVVLVVFSFLQAYPKKARATTVRRIRTFLVMQFPLLICGEFGGAFDQSI